MGEHLCRIDDCDMLETFELLNPNSIEALFYKIITHIDQGIYDEILHSNKDINSIIDTKIKDIKA
jgi:hypothetical protein